MIGIVFIGVVTALAVFAILAKKCTGGPKKAEKWEKGEIIKQLLALSDGENSSAAIASPPARSRSASTSATRSDTLRKGHVSGAQLEAKLLPNQFQAPYLTRTKPARCRNRRKNPPTGV